MLLKRSYDFDVFSENPIEIICAIKYHDNNTNFYSTFFNLKRHVDVNRKSGIVINKKDQQCTQAEHVLVSTKGNERT